MNLVVTSNKSIEELEKLTIDKFGQIKNLNVQKPQFNEPNCWPKSSLGKLIKYVPIKDEDELLLNWILPTNYDKDWRKKPLEYFSHLIGHEGENSLISLLIA